MKKIILLAILSVILSLSLSSCTNNTSNTPNQIHIGSQGVELNFMTGNPPSSVYKGEQLNIILEVKNKGAYPNTQENVGQLFDGKIYLYGYDTTLIDSFPAKQLPSDLYGKDEFNTEGGYATMNFLSQNVNLPQGADSLPTEIQAAVCYRYQTIASPTVCIDPDPYTNKIKNKPCNINQVSMTSTQGAPVAVTSVQEDVLQDKIKFKITVSNVGGGLIVEQNNINKCPANLDYLNTDIVYVSGEISNSNIYCTNNGQLKLRNGIGTILCDANKPVEEISAYRTPLKIKLDYGYTKNIKTSLRIVNNRLS